MEFRNSTQFPSLAYEGLDQFDQEFYVVALRATFDILPDNSLTFSDKQVDLLTEDQYFGEPHKSSLKQENDLVPFKPNCDAIVIGSAYAPGNTPSPSFNVELKISRGTQEILKKTLTVTGPRYWRETGKDKWELTAPEPITKLPLRYEYAYGGENRIELNDPAAPKLKDKDLLTPDQRKQHPEGPEKAPAAHNAYEYNPVGIGYYEQWYLEAARTETPARNIDKPGMMDRLVDATGKPLFKDVTGRTLPAPQIESPDDPIKEFGRKYRPQGLGVVTKAWQPRLKLAGTMDQEFIASGEWLPEDFDFAYYNGAHPDMQIPYLKGDEKIQLTNILNSGPPAELTLPGHRAHLLVRFEDGRYSFRDLRIDTLVIDAEQKTVTLVHRSVLAKLREISGLEVRMLDKNKADELDQLRKEIQKHLERKNEQGTDGRGVSNG